MTEITSHYSGAIQQFIPYHQAIEEKKFKEGEQFQFKVGVQNHTYAKDLFDIKEGAPMPVCPALKLKTDLDGTSTPSFEGLEDLKPEV